MGGDGWVCGLPLTIREFREPSMQRRQLSDEVASYLRRAIMSGELAPGQSVRAEAVGEILDVSATPVREALHALRVEGFLELAPRKGFTVSPLSAGDVRDIFVAHALIAGELTYRAAEMISDGQVAELEEIHGQLSAAARTNSTGELDRLNHDFHRAIYRAADSERLRWALTSFTKYAPGDFYSRSRGWRSTTADDHGAILVALREHDASGARELMERHIRSAGEQLAEFVDQRQKSGGHADAGGDRDDTV